MFPKSAKASGPETRRKPYRHAWVEELEPRVLFSAAPAADSGDSPVVEEAVVPNQDAIENGDSVDSAEIRVGSSTVTESLTSEELARLADAAVERWVASGISEVQLDALKEINYQLSDLGTGLLAAVEGSTITVDLDGGGRGWFLDGTPLEDEEYFSYGANGALMAWDDSLASGARDLLTVLLHEQGHVLGLEDLDGGTETLGQVMDSNLTSGQRRLPVAGQALGAEPGTLEGVHLVTGNFEILFDYSFDTQGFFDDQARRDALEAAALVYEGRILDDLNAIVPGGSNTWQAIFQHPGTGAEQRISNLTVPADSIIVYVGGQNISGASIGYGGSGGWSGSGSQSWLNNLEGRGESGALLSTPTDYSVWGGFMSFDTGENWSFSLDAAPTGGATDFFSVALHELAHVLGSGASDSWYSLVNASNQFTGSEAVASYGGLVPLASGGAHWAEGTMSTLPGTSTTQEAANDPSLTAGTRKVLTDLDWAGLDDIGWEIGTASVAGITIVESDSSTSVVEGGGTDTLQLVLTGSPTSSVWVTLTPSNGEIDLGNGAGAAISYRVRTGTASVPRIVTITAVDDTDIEGSHGATITISTSSSDANFDGLSGGTIAVNVEDNDVAVQALNDQAIVAEDGSVAIDVLGNDRILDGTWPESLGYVLQADLLAGTKAGAITQLSNADRDWLILDVSYDVSEAGRWTVSDLDTIRASNPDRKVLAYLSIGEAENYRSYWQASWDANHDGTPDPGAPSFLTAENPDWAGNYKVKYWQQAWQDLILAEVDRITAAGFDGVYLDIVDAFEFFEYDETSGDWIDYRNNPETGQSYRQDMIDWVSDIATRARNVDPGFMVVPQNGFQLLEVDEFLNLVDAIGAEDIFTDGNQVQPAADVAWTTSYLDLADAAGKPVFIVEYGTTTNARQASQTGTDGQDWLLLLTDRALTGLGTTFNYHPLGSGGGTLALTGFTQGAHGTVSLGSNGRLLYTPDPNFEGEDQFQYQVSNGLGATDSATVYVTVIGLNDAPEFDPIADQEMAHTQDTLVVDLVATDLDGDALAFTAEAFQADALEQQAYELDQANDFVLLPSASLNYRGLNEKYFMGLGRTTYFYILENGDVYRWGGSIAASTRIGTLDRSYWSDVSKLVDVAQPTVTPVPEVTLSVNGNQLTIDPDAGYTGQFTVRVTASDGASEVTQEFAVSVVNREPTLSPIADQEMAHTQDTLVVDLVAADLDGDALAFTAEAFRVDALEQLAYELDQANDFVLLPSASLNYRGLNEKYFMGLGRTTYFYILENGDVYRWGGSIAASTRIGTLDRSYWSDMSKLVDVAEPTVTPVPEVTLSVNGNQLTIDPDAGYTGQFTVRVTASDGASEVTQEFAVSVVNREPTLSPIADQEMAHTQDTLVVDLVATDLDGDALAFTAEAFQADALEQLAYELDQANDFVLLPSASLNYRGLNEKYFMGLGRTTYFYILENGEVYRWGGSIAASTRIGTLDRSYWSDMSKLVDVAEPTVTPVPEVTLSVNGNQLTIDPDAGYTGQFTVRVTASDGASEVTQEFAVSVVNREPTLSPIADQEMAHTQDTLVVDLVATDLDGDALAFTAEAFQADALEQLAYELDQANDFVLLPSASLNYRGLNEKYFMGLGRTTYFYILENGEVYRWGGSIAASTRIGTLDRSYWSDMSKLVDVAQPTVTPVPEVTLSVNGNQLTIDPNAGYTGQFTVRVMASDGASEVTQEFAVSVVNREPTLSPIADQEMAHTQDTLVVDLVATDLDGDALAFTAEAFRVDALEQQAYELDQANDFVLLPSASLNYRGLNEKYFMGLGRTTYFYILENGEVYRWGGSIAASSKIGTLDRSYWSDMSKLVDVVMPVETSVPEVSLSINGNQLTIDPADGYAGTFSVRVTATDGAASSRQEFSVVVS